MRYRKLRIAWSVMWGLGGVLPIAFWVRSYAIRDSALFQRDMSCVEFNSMRGNFVMFIAIRPFGAGPIRIRHNRITPNDEARVQHGILGFFYSRESDPTGHSTDIHIHFW